MDNATASASFIIDVMVLLLLIIYYIDKVHIVCICH